MERDFCRSVCVDYLGFDDTSERVFWVVTSLMQEHAGIRGLEEDAGKYVFFGLCAGQGQRNRRWCLGSLLMLIQGMFNPNEGMVFI